MEQHILVSVGAGGILPGATVTSAARPGRVPDGTPCLSRRWAERRFTDIRHWGGLDRGGHVAALEQPEILVSELRASFRLLR